MPTTWTKLFTQATPAWADAETLAAPVKISTLEGLKHFLDLVHIKFCLAKPYFELEDYPVVEARELLPSFECDPWEHKDLPGFSLVALGRTINYFSEVFQFDMLRSPETALRADHAESIMSRNISLLQQRLPKSEHEKFRNKFNKENICSLNLYPALTPFLSEMDRAQVIGLRGSHPQDMHFYLAGVYASLPSDLDTEVKRYGVRIGKFSVNDYDSYEKNRMFVLQHLMELYGYPVASERRTSAALFARKLHKMGEKFLIRTLGQSDRTLTTMWNNGTTRHYPMVEKIALVKMEEIDSDLAHEMEEKGFFLDPIKRVAIVRVMYKQHKFRSDNIRQERAISVKGHEIIHPLTGLPLAGFSILKYTNNMVLRVNDIVHGEYTGRIVYKRAEIVENTDTEEKRLKFLYAWLSKHQRRIVGYSDDFFADIDKILHSYLFSDDPEERFSHEYDLYLEVENKYRYIVQARKIRLLEDVQARNIRGVKISYSQMLEEAVALLHELKFEIVSYFDTLACAAIKIGTSMLNDRYLTRTYIDKPEDELTPTGLEIKRNYGKLVALVDDLTGIQKSRRETDKRNTSCAGAALRASK